jgi:hypothetical protein
MKKVSKKSKKIDSNKLRITLYRIKDLIAFFEYEAK